MRRHKGIYNDVLVLNKSYMAIDFKEAGDAFSLVYQGHAKILDKDFSVYDWSEWMNLPVADGEDFIGLTHGRKMRVPRTIVLANYDRYFDQNIKLSRSNLFERDDYTCQYCGATTHDPKAAKWTLNIDHVFPRSRGGQSNWDNLVTSCHECNNSKADRTPEEAGMKLAKRPHRPKWISMLAHLKDEILDEWKQFLWKN